MYSLLCVIYLAVLSPFLAAALDNTALKTILAAGIVAVVTQLVKRWVSNDSPWVGIVTNALTSLTAIFLATNHATLFTAATGLQVLAVFTAAAGIHSTARALGKPAADTGSSPAGRAALVTAFVLGAALMLSCFTGCKPVTAATPATLPAGAVDSVDAKANEDLQAIHAFLATVSTGVQSGNLTLTATQVALLNKANAAVNVADAAEQAYHNAGGGSASVLAAAMTAAEQAFTAVQSSLAASATSK